MTANNARVGVVQSVARLILQGDVALSGPFRIAVEGHSMMPAFRPGDIVEVTTPEDRIYGVGDVVMFRVGTALTLHRILAICGQWAITRGDARLAPDRPIPASAIVGRVAGAPRCSWTGGMLARLQRLASGTMIQSLLRLSPSLAARAADISQQIERGTGFDRSRRLVRAGRNRLRIRH